MTRSLNVVHPCASRRRLLGWALGGIAAGCAGWALAEQAMRFGILPIGGALESRNDWSPLLAQLSQLLGQRVKPVSVASYEVLEQLIQRQELDMAYLSGRMAVDAVVLHGMQVIAQVSRHDSLQPGYRATMLALKGGPVRSLDDVLTHAERWRLARGSAQSLSGYIVPQLELFLPRGIRMETHFASELISTHQTTALAVANQEADVGLSNTADFERFRLQFPAEASRIQVLWASEPIAHEVIVIRRQLPAALHKRVQDFLARYARGEGAQGDAERAVLKALHDFAGFEAAGNRALIPAEKTGHALAVESARASRWVNEAALQTRLQRLDAEHQERMAVLSRD